MGCYASRRAAGATVLAWGTVAGGVGPTSAAVSATADEVGITAVAVISTNCPVYPRQDTPMSVDECGPVLSPEASTTSQTAESTAGSLLTTYTSVDTT